ncbi:MAG: DUF192 domain-containing protein [Anaerolineaceae bacterium]|nr:DUF192 domain-containing protein [Anaerolineaceae bacterium]
MKIIKISKVLDPSTIVKVKLCETFWSKFIGLMFSKEIKSTCGIVLVESYESKLNTSIHMLFMNYDITVLWLNQQKVIVDKVLAKKWSPFYIPKKPAQYVVELHPSKFSEYSVGEQLAFLNEE